MDCSSFLRLAEALRRGDSSRYGYALFEWHRRTCPRCAAATARVAKAARPSLPARTRAAVGARTA